MIGLQSSLHFLNKLEAKPTFIMLGHLPFPALDTGYMYLLQVLIGGLCSLHLL